MITIEFTYHVIITTIITARDQYNHDIYPSNAIVYNGIYPSNAIVLNTTMTSTR